MPLDLQLERTPGFVARILVIVRNELSDESCVLGNVLVMDTEPPTIAPKEKSQFDI